MRLACSGLYAISKYGYPPSIDNTYRVLRDMAGLGFKYVELEGVGEANLRDVWAERKGLLREAKTLGLRIVNFCPVLPDLVHADGPRRQRARALFDVAVETALSLECESIQTDSFTGPLTFIDDTPYNQSIRFGHGLRVAVDEAFRWPDVWDALIDGMRYCARTSTEAGLRFCLEPRMGELISNTDGFLRLSDAVAERNFGILLDTGHQNAQKEILVLSIEKLGPRIVYVHVADNDGTSNEHRALGDGSIDWEQLLLALRKHNFDGCIAVDVGNVDDIDRAVQNSQRLLRSMAARLDIRLDG